MEILWRKLWLKVGNAESLREFFVASMRAALKGQGYPAPNTDYLAARAADIHEKVNAALTAHQNWKNEQQQAAKENREPADLERFRWLAARDKVNALFNDLGAGGTVFGREAAGNPQPGAAAADGALLAALNKTRRRLRGPINRYVGAKALN